MKYLMQAIKETKTMRRLILDLIITGISLFIDAKILIYVNNAVNNPDDSFYWVTLIIVGSIVCAIISVISAWISGNMSKILICSLSNILIDKYSKADYEMFTKYSPGELLSVHTGMFKFAKIPNLAMRAFVQLFRILVTIYMIGTIDMFITIPIVISCSIGGAVLYKINKKWIKLDTAFDNARRARDKQIDELVNGFAEMRTFNKVTNIMQKSAEQLNDDIVDISRSRTRYNMALHLSIETTNYIVVTMIVMYGIILIQNNAIQSSMVITIVAYCWRLIGPIKSLINMMSDLSEYTAPMPKFNEVMLYENKIKNGSIELTSFNRFIKIRDVKFSYNKSDNVLDGVTLDIRKGEKIGICGVSGGGKTTLLKLIPRMYDVDEGSIRIDGINIKDIERESLKKYIGTVHQDTYIFNKSVMENIRFAKPSATDNEVIEATKKAYAYDFILNLPDGFNTEVGPKGLKLSGGQKQRISLARVFLANPDIVLLDEATSALDMETERLVQKAINQFEDKTVIAVAHRLSTIKDFDRIVVIDQHKIVEVGSHDGLLKRGGLYYDLWQSSLKGEEV